MQLSLVSELPAFEKKVFLDIYAKGYFDTRRSKMRLKTIEGQAIPADLVVGCTQKALSQFPEGTIYKIDARLIKKEGKKPYFVAAQRKCLERALEFFEHNLRLQQGKEDCSAKKVRKVVRVRSKARPFEEEFVTF